MTLTDHYQALLIFLLVGVVMVVAPMVMLALLRPRKPLLEKAIPYECGKDPIGDAQVCFDLRFYSDALIFVIFDVEAAFMFPWARVYRSFSDRGLSGFALVEGAIFVGVLFLGLIYVWAKGDIDWIKSIGGQPSIERKEGVAPELPEGPRDLAELPDFDDLAPEPAAPRREPATVPAGPGTAAPH
jgi:NADH-quinone oxidoreductase subunit A